MTKFKKPTKAVLSDAGFGSRFLPIVKTIPKSLIPLGNKPAMQYIVEECVHAGIEEIIIVATPEGKPMYEDYFTNPVPRMRALLESQGKMDRYKSVEEILNFPKITVVLQDPELPYGNGSPFVSVRDMIDEDEAFIAIYSDDIVVGGEGAVKALMDEFDRRGGEISALMGAQETPGREVEKYGVIKFKEGTDEVEFMVEKPKMEEAPSHLAVYGRYILTPKVFKYLNKDETGKDAELWMTDAVSKLAGSDGGVYAVTVADGTWCTTGDPKGWFMTQLKMVMDENKYADEVKEFVARY
ncbi:sugar phosphate nucleotidyltransferase [Candidatus Saccharibacteria bacterium]|nr:sugar phosphate nucleotidyltransferase [Candidatus Saccharibacteria bacterium]MCL1963008.1 sugar phosphate nucleotidyltransferase [Candidatus Saccharibacteria bacterium]